MLKYMDATGSFSSPLADTNLPVVSSISDSDYLVTTRGGGSRIAISAIKSLLGGGLQETFQALLSKKATETKTYRVKGYILNAQYRLSTHTLQRYGYLCCGSASDPSTNVDKETYNAAYDGNMVPVSDIFEQFTNIVILHYKAPNSDNVPTTTLKYSDTLPSLYAYSSNRPYTGSVMMLLIP